MNRPIISGKHRLAANSSGIALALAWTLLPSTGMTAENAVDPQKASPRTAGSEGSAESKAVNVELLKKRIREKWEHDFQIEMPFLTKILSLSKESEQTLESGYRRIMEDKLPELLTALEGKLDWAMVAGTGSFEEMLMFSLLRELPETAELFFLFRNKSWVEFLQAHLIPEQKDSLHADLEKQRKDIERSMTSIEPKLSMALERTIDSQIAALEFSQSFSEERSMKLREHARSLFTEMNEVERKKNIHAALHIPRAARSRFQNSYWQLQSLNPGQSILSVKRKSAAEEAWKRLCDEFLTQEESKEVPTGGSIFVSESRPALARFLLSKLGVACGMSVEQMRKLETVVERSLDERSMSSVNESWRFIQFIHFNLQPQKQPPIQEKDLATVLDADQLSRWKHLLEKNFPGGGSAAGNPLPPAEQSSANLLAEIEKDGLISHVLDRQLEKLLGETLQGYLHKIEDWNRILQLDPQAIRSLQLAAKGVSDFAVQCVKDSHEQTLRSHMDRLLASSPDVKLPVKLQQLANLQPPRQKWDQNPIWRDTVERVLSVESREKLEQSARALQAYRAQALGSLLTLILAEQIGLRKNQVESCGKEITRVLEKYGPELMHFFRETPILGIRDERANIRPNIPVAFVALDLLKSENAVGFLSPAQLERFEKHPAREQSVSYFESVKNSHQARIQKPNAGAPAHGPDNTRNRD